MTLKELREKLLKLLNDARDITAKAEKEERDFSDDERDQEARTGDAGGGARLARCLPGSSRGP